MGPLRTPPADFATCPLPVVSIAADQHWWRLYRNPPHAKPLGFGYGPSRFSDPRLGLPKAERYGVVYLGASIEVCFLETILRDARDGVLGDWPIPYTELQQWWCARLTANLRFTSVSLREGGAVPLGIPTDVIRGSDHAGGQAWSLALWSHPQRLDGLLYSSRFNEQPNLAVFDRAIPKLQVEAAAPLLACRAELTDLLTKYKLAIV